MKIAFVISCINSKSEGGGGHYYSLLETAYQLGKEHQVLIISIGDVKPKAYNNISLDYVHFDYQNKVLGTYQKLKNIIKDESVDLIHAFDKISYFWVRLVSWREKLPSCLTICGGKNLKYYPLANDIILFSKENQAYFSSNKKYEHSRIYLVPNRLKEFSSDKIRIEKILKTLNEKKDWFKFLRIVRIGDYYHKSSLQLINLVKRLNEDNIKCCAIFIGSIEDESFFKKLKDESSGDVFFFTENYFNTNAKELISLSDAVLGTGRSFMEASSKGKILLTPSQFNIPALITENNFEEAFYYNFSERVVYDNYDENKNYSMIKEVILDQKKSNSLEQLSLKLFASYFNSEALLSVVGKIYKDARPSKLKMLDLLTHMLMVIKRSFIN